MNKVIFYLIACFGSIISLLGEGYNPASLFRVASTLTDPICKTHEYIRRFAMIDGDRSPWFQKMFLSLCLFEKFRSALWMTVPGSVLRALAIHLEKDPFIYLKEKNHVPKQLPKDRKFTLFSWNVCCVAAGYPITDGGVFPWSHRIDAIADKVIEQNADVNCLYETFDLLSAFHLYERLKKEGYGYFYFNIGPQVIGASSGIFIASKYEIARPEFLPFPKTSAVGRTKFVEKGVFAFDLQNDHNAFARIFATHLQHSEEPAFPTGEEQHSRQEQMNLLVTQMFQEQSLHQTKEAKAFVVTGDLNLDDREYHTSLWSSWFQKSFFPLHAPMSWGGDEFCAKLMEKQVSVGLNLDHTMVLNETARSIHTSLVDVHFDPSLLRDAALSDHLGLLSEIEI